MLVSDVLTAATRIEVDSKGVSVAEYVPLEASAVAAVVKLVSRTTLPNVKSVFATTLKR